MFYLFILCYVYLSVSNRAKLSYRSSTKCVTTFPGLPYLDGILCKVWSVSEGIDFWWLNKPALFVLACITISYLKYNSITKAFSLFLQLTSWMQQGWQWPPPNLRQSQTSLQTPLWPPLWPPTRHLTYSVSFDGSDWSITLVKPLTQTEGLSVWDCGGG